MEYLFCFFLLVRDFASEKKAAEKQTTTKTSRVNEPEALDEFVVLYFIFVLFGALCTFKSLAMALFFCGTTNFIWRCGVTRCFDGLLLAAHSRSLNIWNGYVLLIRKNNAPKKKSEAINDINDQNEAFGSLTNQKKKHLGSVCPSEKIFTFTPLRTWWLCPCSTFKLFMFLSSLGCCSADLVQFGPQHYAA